MDNLIFSLNATMPIFLLIVVGYVIMRIGWVTVDFAEKMNSFVFQLALPLAVFNDLAGVDFSEAWNGKFVLFCFIVTLLCIGIAFIVSRLLPIGHERGEYIQASYRSSAAILGLAFVQNMYGHSGMSSMMIIGAVPLYNIFAVIVLSLTSPDNGDGKIDKKLLLNTFIKVIKNPILIGVAAGLIWSAIGLPTPKIMFNVVSRIGATATPLGLIAMGACFEFKAALNSGKYAVLASFFKLIGNGLIFIPIAYALGFRGEELVAIVVMNCSATTVSCYVMARNMGHKGNLTSAAVMLTTLFAAVTLTLWIFILRTVGAI